MTLTIRTVDGNVSSFNGIPEEEGTIIVNDFMDGLNFKLITKYTGICFNQKNVISVTNPKEGK